MNNSRILDVSSLNDRLKYYSECSRKRLDCRKINSTIKIHIYIGPRRNQQICSFENALNEICLEYSHIEINAEVLDSDTLKNDTSMKYHPKYLVDWLLESDSRNFNTY